MRVSSSCFMTVSLGAARFWRAAPEWPGAGAVPLRASGVARCGFPNCAGSGRALAAAAALSGRVPGRLVVRSARDEAAALTGVRVAIADDSALIREGVARVLEAAGFEVVAQVGDAVDLMRTLSSGESSRRPQVVVIDIRMPPTHTDEGVRAARRIREAHPGV